MIVQGRGRPQGNINKTDRGLLSYFKGIIVFKVGAARRATSTKVAFAYFQKIQIFQGRGRPLGNTDKSNLCLFPHNFHFSRSGPFAGQRRQN